MLVLLLAAGAVWAFDDTVLATVTARYGLLVYIAGAVLATFFHRSRVVVSLLALAFVEAVAHRLAGDALLLAPLGTFLVLLLGVLALMRDQGIRSRGGVAQLVLGVAMTYGPYALFLDPARAAAFHEVRLLPAGALVVLRVPQAMVVLGAAGVLGTLYGVVRWKGPIERALLWSQIFVLVSLDPAIVPAESSLLLMAAGLVLSLSVLEHSYSMAYRDELTGLPARRALVRALDEMGGTYTLAMVDVDHFKKFNDKHGHDVGDQVLKLVASRLGSAPGGAKAYRYGGEEFTLVYPGRTSEQALPHAEAARASVERETFALRAWTRPRKKPSEAKRRSKGKKPPKKLSVTVSIGLADSGSKEATPESVLKRADEALYRAKSRGRNRVSV